MTRQYIKWTKEMEAFLVIKRTNGMSMADLKLALKEKFNVNPTVYSIRNKCEQLGLTSLPSGKHLTPNNKGKKYFKPNQRQINFIHAMALNGFNINKIIEAYEEQFEFKLTEKHVAKALGKEHTLNVPKTLETEKVIPSVKNDWKAGDWTAKWQDEPATRKQCRYIIANTTDLKGSAKSKEVMEAFSTNRWTKGEASDIISKFENKGLLQSDKVINSDTENLVSSKRETGISNLNTNRWTEEEVFELISFKLQNPKKVWPSINGRSRNAIQQKWIKLKNTIKPSDYHKYLPKKLGLTTGKWSEKEDMYLILAYNEGKTYRTMAKELNRKLDSVTNRLPKLKRQGLITKNNSEKPLTDSIQKQLNRLELKHDEIKEEMEEYLKPNVAETTWTEEEDFDILCNFYEYSIDEARNRFNVPYSVIAGRLEMLIDSTEPAHIEMLMEATKTIKERRSRQAKVTKEGPYCRWKKRRKAKKEMKRQRRIEYRLKRVEDILNKENAKRNKKIAKAEKKLNKLRGD